VTYVPQRFPTPIHVAVFVVLLPTTDEGSQFVCLDFCTIIRTIDDGLDLLTESVVVVVARMATKLTVGFYLEVPA